MTSVEAAAVSAIISGTLKIVGNKLAPLLIKEYSSIVGVKEDLQELHDLVEEINFWLETTAGSAIGSRQSFAWLKRLKDISYDVDDVVDEFQLKSEKHDSDGADGIVSRYLCKIPKSFVFQCKAANKIKAIKKRFAAIVKQRTDYLAITNSLSVDPSVRHINMRTKEVPSLSNIDEALVVGRDKDKQKIISMLEENDDQQKIKIVSVIGLGGSGKTTLAKLVYNDGNIIEKHFDVRLWVYVSKEFVVKDLIKKVFEAFSDNNPGPHALPYMIKTISEKLIGKRFLLVLDDVWTNSQDEWEEFMVYIKGGEPRSRILLTTRNREVAIMVGSTDQFHLPFLSPDDSWQLFQQSLATPATGWNFEFEGVGKVIVDKCGGVPLAIKFLAGALHGKEQIEEWQAMRDKKLSNVNGKEDRVASCLRLSYFHLPSNLKQCFTICSLFPKGHRIDKEQLIDLWIAHDMITLEDGFDYLNLEYVGHKHFNSLVQASFLQNVKEEDGIVTCGMHDLVHDLALSILGNEISLDVPNEATSITKRYRYFSMIEKPENLVPNFFFRKARAVYMPMYEDSIYGKALKHAKHLRSVMVGYLYAEEANTISQIKTLKYLGMSVMDCKTLPEDISHIWRLQALHLTHSYSLLELPKSIGKLKKLRTLNLSSCENLKSLPDSIGDCKMISNISLCNCKKLTLLPASIGKLQKLRTLNLSNCKGLKCLPDSIGDCKMISSIYLCNCKELTELPNSIGKLQKLTTLNLSQCEGLKCLPYSIGDCHMISSIDLWNCKQLKTLPDSIGRNKNLRVLRLGCTNIERLPTSVTTLNILECLDLHSCQELVELPEGIGNLKKLQVLNIEECEKLAGIPVGIGQLSGLQKLGLFVVGEGTKFAGISELANVSRISEELTIRGISHGMDPNDAHKACLKQKANLQRLDLWWMTHNSGEVNAELEQATLDGLEPPPGIKELEIQWYSGIQYARWMQNQVCSGDGVQGRAAFLFLRVMKLYDFPNLKHLHGLVELPCLEDLVLERMPSLQSISGGPFPSLAYLVMVGLPNLGELWMIADRAMPDGEEEGSCNNFTPHLGSFLVGNCLSGLCILHCPKLKVKPHLPLSLQRLMLTESSQQQVLQSSGQCQGSSSSSSSRFSRLKELELRELTGSGSSGCGWDPLQHMTALESLEISGQDELTELPESFRCLTSIHLKSLEICAAIHVLPEWLVELQSLQKLAIQCCRSLSSLPQTMGHLTSLQELVIESCDTLEQLPDCLGELCSLRKLEIEELPRVTCLPQSIFSLTSLEELVIGNCPGLASLPEGIDRLSCLEKLRICACPGIESLPEGIKRLTGLMELKIYDCPDLVRRCKIGNGEDWPLISHIPHLGIL